MYQRIVLLRYRADGCSILERLDGGVGVGIHHHRVHRRSAGLDALEILLHANGREEFPDILAAFYLPPVGKDKPVEIEILLLELILDSVGNIRLLLRRDADGDERLVQFVNVPAVVLAVIAQFLADAEGILGVAVIFALEAFVIATECEGAVARPASNQLRLCDGACAGLALVGITRLVKADNVKEVQDIPALVQFLDLEDGTVGIVFAFQRIEQNLPCIRLLVVIDRDAVLGLNSSCNSCASAS